jgi:HEAT repeat protein
MNKPKHERFEMIKAKIMGAVVLMACVGGGDLSPAIAQESAAPAHVVTERRATTDDGAVRQLIERLRSPKSDERADAAFALGRMEAKAAAAIPSLVELLGDGAPVMPREIKSPPFEDEEWQPDYETVKETTVGEAATHALMAIGDESIDALTDALVKGSNWRARKNAAWALAHRGDRRAVDQMIVALTDKAWQVRAQAAYALFQRGGARAEVVNALIVASRDEAWQVREQAVFALGHKGSSTVDVVAPLLDVLRLDADARVRRMAAGALWHTANSRAFPVLLEALKDDSAPVRAAVADTLGNRVDNEAVKLLIAALKDSDARVRAGARRALQIVKHRSEGTQTNLRPLPSGIPE